MIYLLVSCFLSLFVTRIEMMTRRFPKSVANVASHIRNPENTTRGTFTGGGSVLFVPFRMEPNVMIVPFGEIELSSNPNVSIIIVYFYGFYPADFHGTVLTRLVLLLHWEIILLLKSLQLKYREN